jgi:hypothetical protein
MITEAELIQIETRIAAASGIRWDRGEASDGSPVIVVEFRDGRTAHLTVTREREPAADHDVDFIAYSRDDVERLIAFLRSERPISDAELRAIERRCAQASPGPWKAFLESEGGLGGGNVIWVSEANDEPDLYLWVSSGPASDADFDFVAAARQDLPRLLKEAQRRNAS